MALAGSKHLTIPLRLQMGCFGSLLVGLLVIAGGLTPNPNGLGTHEQLGFPACSFRRITQGLPCPSCGMTTSWSYLLHGQPIRALSANIGGTLLAIFAAVAGPWMIGTAIRARPLFRPPTELQTVSGVILLILLTLGQWAWRVGPDWHVLFTLQGSSSSSSAQPFTETGRLSSKPFGKECLEEFCEQPLEFRHRGGNSLHRGLHGAKRQIV